MSGELSGKVALVTGAARNIGRAIALQLAAEGAAVAVAARSDAEAATRVADDVRAAGGDAIPVIADVTKPDDVARMMEAVLQRFGRLDILVNNAAVRREAAFEDIAYDEWRDILAVGLDGPFLVSQAAVPALAATGAGTIVNIGGMTGYTGAKRRAHVVAAKAGLDGLTKALAIDLADRGITVNLVSPGMIDTPRVSGQQPLHHASHATLVGRRGTPDEVAAMVRFLAGPQARYITGQTMHVNGGAFLP